MCSRFFFGLFLFYFVLFLQSKESFITTPTQLMIKCPELLVSTEKKFKLPKPIQRIKGGEKGCILFFKG